MMGGRYDVSSCRSLLRSFIEYNDNPLTFFACMSQHFKK